MYNYIIDTSLFYTLVLLLRSDNGNVNLTLYSRNNEDSSIF